MSSKALAKGIDRNALDRSYIIVAYRERYGEYPRSLEYRNGAWWAESQCLDMAGNPYRYEVSVSGNGFAFKLV